MMRRDWRCGDGSFESWVVRKWLVRKSRVIETRGCWLVCIRMWRERVVWWEGESGSQSCLGVVLIHDEVLVCGSF